MAKWNKVISGFDAEDETANFGNRNFAENNGSIYETWTLATIESDGDNVDESTTIKNPNITATIWYERTCVVVDSCITIFHDQSCQDVLSSIGFDSPITSYCLSVDGTLLFISIEQAILHCFSLIDVGRQIFTIDFMKEYKCSHIIKVCLNETKNNMNVTVVTSIGNIYRINGIDRAQLNNQVIDYRQTINNIDLISTHSPIKYAAQIDFGGDVNESCGDNQTSLAIVGEELCLLPDGISCNLEDLPYDYTKIQFFNNYNAMICLRTDGCLSIVCVTTLLGIKIWNGPVKDFLAIEERSHDSHQILVLMAPQNNESSTSLHLMSFPNFNLIFTMSVSSSTYLVDIIGGSVDRLIFVEGVVTSDDSLDVIRIKAIEEGMPEFRLQRLLRQRRFDEALAFANKFNLDIESVYRAEASMFMNCLRPRTDNEENIDLHTFKSILDKITDIKFVYECCNNILTCDYRDTRNLFEYAHDRMIAYIKGHSKSGKNDVDSLLQNVSNTLRKLETFEIIQKIRSTDQMNENGHVNEWNTFSKADLLDECIKFLSLGELNAAALVWVRHTPCFAQKVTKQTVMKILEAIPVNLQPSHLWPWLRHFIPSVTSFFPGALEEIIHWGFKKTKTFETFHRSNWPDIGLKFANGFIDLLHFDEYNVCSQFHQQYAHKNSQFHQLTRLVQAMTDLLELKLRYKVIVPLSTYLGDPTDVINLLLTKVHIDSIIELMENFLQTYMLNNSLQNDKVLSNFISNTLRNSKNLWLWEKAQWDKRITVVIGYIHNVQNRLQQTLQVLKKAPVPWSEALIQLAERSYIFDHPLVLQIRCESNRVAEKLILKKYGFAHTSQCSKLFHSIVKQNRASMIDDIFELTKTDRGLRMSILHFCISYHLKQGNIHNMMNIFQQLSDDIVVQCCEQLVYVTQSRLNFLTRRHESMKCIIYEVLGSVETRLQESMAQNSQHSTRHKILLETIPNLRNLYRLNKELNICITINSYIRDKEKILLDYIKKSVHENSGDEINWPNICKKIERANNLLRLPKLFGLYHLLNMFKHVTALKFHISSSLGDHKIILPEESEYANKICSLLVAEPENDSRMTVHLRNLCSSSLICSDKRNLMDNLRLCRYIDMYNEAVGSYVDENDSQTCSTTKSSVRQLYPIYRDASVSSGCVLLPILTDAFKICSFYRTNIEHNNVTNSHNDESAIELLSRSYIERVRAIQNEHHDFSLLQIITTIYFELYHLLPQSKKSLMEIQLALNHCIRTMLRKVISCRVFDLQLGLTCLFLLPEAEALNSLSSIAKFFHADYTRDQVANDLGYEYCRLTNNTNQMERFKCQRVLHYWGQRLMSYGISYREVLHSDTEKKRDISRCIMKSNKPGIIELLHDFCESFGYNIDDCFMTYLESLLWSWEPKYNFNTATNDQSELKINEDDVKELTATCNKIAAQINNKAEMKKHLVNMMTQINFYHYEIFLILLALAEETKNETTWHLCFLQNYTRVGVPTDIEYEEWGKFSQENEPLPIISKWRLPFLPKVDQYNLITPELNFKTYEKWLTIAGVLKIPIHNICTLAIKGAVTEAWKNGSNDHERNTTKWSLNLCNSALLKDIKKCISYMTGADGFYYGTAALYYVVNHTPPGADLVAAAKECFVYSQRWQQESSQSTFGNTKIPKIKEKYFKYTSKHVLYTHGLGQEKYLNLVAHPEKLVRELYKDETIPQRYKCAIGNRPDINSAVNALCSIFTLNCVKARLELLNEWLQPWENWNNKPNDSITANLSQDYSTNSTNDFFVMDDNFLRACYIVGSGDVEAFINYLINIGFSEDREDCYGPGIRFRALRVLQSITDEETLQDYVKRDIQTVNKYMRTLQYLNELERLGLGYSVNGFDTCSKHKLVQLLIKSQYCSPRALGLIPQLYIDFKIDDYSLLADALERMIQLSLVKELKRTLAMLGSVDCIINSSSYIAAWQIIISDPFNKLDVQSSTDTVDNCIETLRVLHACPVIDKLKFTSMVNCCVRTKQWHLAAAFLPFVNNTSDRELIIQVLKESDKSNEIIIKLIELEVKGILIVRQAIIILQEANILPITVKIN